MPTDFTAPGNAEVILGSVERRLSKAELLERSDLSYA
jgi:hypothetical protein